MADKRYMGLKYLFDRKKKSYYNIGFVFDEVPNKLLPFDYETFAGYKGVVEACVTNIHTGKAEYLKVPQSVEMKDTLVASCSSQFYFSRSKSEGIIIWMEESQILSHSGMLWRRAATN